MTDFLFDCPCCERSLENFESPETFKIKCHHCGWYRKIGAVNSSSKTYLEEDDEEEDDSTTYVLY